MKLFGYLIFFMVFLFLMFLGIFKGTFASETKAREALINAGYSKPVLIHRYNFFITLHGCGEKDAAMFVFKAINPAGKPVHAKVCEGWPFKGATIRY